MRYAILAGGSALARDLTEPGWIIGTLSAMVMNAGLVLVLIEIR